MRTYQEVADRYLTGIMRRLYLAYMKKRWASTEESKCLSGYATEWAERFRAGIEYQASDSEGQAVLQELSRVYKIGR